jgi:UPF0271 protein
MVAGDELATVDGGTTRLEAQTLCVHGDGPTAPQVAAAVRAALTAAGVDVRAF